MASRKDTSYAMGCSVGKRNLNDTQFGKVQNDGRVKLSDNLRRRLDDTLVWYSLNEDAERNASTRDNQSKSLRKALECVTFLRRFLNKATEDHSIYGARERVEEELSLLMDAKGFKEDWVTQNDVLDAGVHILELKKRRALSHKKKIYTIIDLKMMNNDFPFLEVAIKKALRKIENESIEDKGGEEENFSLNELLRNLRTIYDKGTGSKKAFERFCHSITETLPENIRPSLPQGVNSISKRANRIKNKQKEFLANQLKTKRKSA